MASSKSKNLGLHPWGVNSKLLWFLLFGYLVVYPFGQFTRIPLYFLPGEVSLYLTDLIVGVIGIVGGIWGKNKITPLNKTFCIFLIAALFSLTLASTRLSLNQTLISGLYLIRLLFYGLFFSTVYNLIQNDKEKKLVLDSLVLVGCATAIGGLIQYFLYTDLRSLLFFGWDEHVNRVAGTFLDPNFTSIILVFTTLLIFGLSHQMTGASHQLTGASHLGGVRWLQQVSPARWILVSVIFFTLLLTYSRSGYLAFVAGLAVYSIILKNIRIWVLGIALLMVGIFVLPKETSEGTKLARTTSINLRIENWQESLELFLAHPVFGVGFNSLRYVREPGVEKYGPSHAASGVDNSFLFVLATTGVVGFIAFLQVLKEIIIASWTNKNARIVTIPTLVALFIHSLFVNSLFYPWVLGWLALLLAAVLRPSKD